MIEKLISILGLLFLIIFLVYAFHVIYIAWKYSKSDHTKDLELLESTKLTSLAVPPIYINFNGSVSKIGTVSSALLGITEINKFKVFIHSVSFLLVNE